MNHDLNKDGATSEVRKTIDETRTELKKKGSAIAEKVAETARDRADESVIKVSQQIRNAEKAALEAAGSMDGTQPDFFIDGTRYLSERIGDVATYFEKRDSKEITDDARKVIRENPGAALATLAVAGFFIGRFLKAGNSE